MTDPITTPAQMREAAARLIDDRCADILGKQDGKTPEVDQNLRLMAVFLPDLAAAIRALPVAEPEPQAVRVKPLVWEETHDDRGDGSSEHNGCYEASTALGVYEIGMGFGSDAYYWSVCDPNYNEIGSFEDPSYAQAAAEADHAARVRSQIDAVPAAQVRAEALEEAATLCDEIGNGVADLVLTGLPEQARLRESMAASFTKAGQCIRALIEKETNE